MKVLLILEDQTHDRFIAEPVVHAMLQFVGIKARVNVLLEPAVQGVSELLSRDMLRTVIAENPQHDLFIVLADRDCERSKPTRKGQLDERISEHAPFLLGTLAEQELEVWMLARHRERVAREYRVVWNEVRTECDVKERLAEPFLKAQGQQLGPGAGRKAAMRDFGQSEYRGLRMVCPEVQALETSIREWRDARTC